MRKFGLIGYPLSHSFSKKFFTLKFENQNITDASYELFPIQSINDLPQLINDNPELRGLNVTIPYKEEVIPLLDHIDPKAKEIGAVNTIKIANGQLIGYNTDYHGFRDSLVKWIGPNTSPTTALILGSGGASKAVKAVLDDLDIDHQFVSRTPTENGLTYDDLSSSTHHLITYSLIINTTPLGMSPDTQSAPDLPYDQLTENHFLFDLVYNPLVTLFMKKGIDKKCWVKNGLEMLYGQAEEAWEIWNK